MKLTYLTVALLLTLAAPATARPVPHQPRHHATHHANPHRAGYKEVPDEEFNPPMESLWSAPQILQLALHDGEEYWHSAPPCNGEIQFQADIAQQPTPAQQREVPGDLTSMWATWSDNVEGTEWFWREGRQFDAANFTNCVIHYNAESWSSAYMMTKWWPALATDVAHELEHLENRWQIETPVDGGSLPLASVPKTAVNYPEWTGYNEPATAELHRPPYARTQRQACASWPC